MNKLILFTLLLVLSTSTLSFAQDTEKPKKERNWIVGIGWAPPTDIQRGSANGTVQHYNATVGYRGFTVSYYRMPTELFEIRGSQHFGYAYGVLNETYQYLTVGYQHVFSKKSNAEVKPIIGFEYGFTAYFVNTGIRYKRSQVLLSMGYYNNSVFYNRTGRLVGLIPFYELVYNKVPTEPSITLKYQFLF